MRVEQSLDSAHQPDERRALRHVQELRLHRTFIVSVSVSVGVRVSVCVLGSWLGLGLGLVLGLGLGLGLGLRLRLGLELGPSATLAALSRSRAAW